MEITIKHKGWINQFTCFMLGVNEFYFNNTDICFFTRSFIKAILILIWRTFLVLLLLAFLLIVSVAFGKHLLEFFGFPLPGSWKSHLLMFFTGLGAGALCVAAGVGAFISLYYVKEKVEDWWDEKVAFAEVQEEPGTFTKMYLSWKDKYCSKVRLK